MKKSFMIAVMNEKNYRTQNRFFSIILFICISLFIITFTIANGFISISEEYKTDDITLREVEIWDDRSDDLNTEYLKQIASRPEVNDASQFFNIELKSNYTLNVDGNVLQCISMMRGCRRGFSFLPKTQTYDVTSGKFIDPIVFGRNFDFKDKKKAIIDENTCYILGYSSPSEAIGKKISIVLSDVIVNNIEVVGVCSYQYGNYYSNLKDIDESSRKGYFESELCNPVFFSDDIIQWISQSDDITEFYYENFIVLIDNTDHVKNFCRTVTDSYEYTTSNLIYEIEKKATEVRNISLLLYMIVLIVFLISIFCIINTLIIKIDNQKKFSEILLKIGYKKNNISCIYILENILISLKTGIYSMIFCCILTVMIDAFMYKGYQEISSKDKYVFLINPKIVFILLLCIIIIIVFITMIVSITQLRKIGRRIKR